MTIEDRKEYMKNWREANKEKIKEKYDNWVVNNRDKRSVSNKIYREENKEKIKIIKKEYELKNRHITAWRNVLKCNLRRIGKKKEGHTIDLLGYSALELKTHIESLFTDGMSWGNYGEWHVDHIIGVINFDITTPTYIVNALSNLRPMWATTREINGVIYKGNLNREKK